MLSAGEILQQSPLIALFAHIFWTTDSPTPAPLSGLSRLLCLVLHISTDAVATVRASPRTLVEEAGS